MNRVMLHSYYEARKHKRNTINASEFEIDFEHNVFVLCIEILTGTYKSSPSICFIVNEPVKREVFAAHFRDRVVQHYVIHQTLVIFENQFIYDNYSCRKEKGVIFGVDRLKRAIRRCSDNYHKIVYILKLDIQGCFMSISRELMLEKVHNLINKKYDGWDKEWILSVSKEIITNDPTEGCIIKGKRSDWIGLAKNKSLFYMLAGFGIPIGNITSQIFVNYFLTFLDKFIKEVLKIKFYGRYADDFYIIHEDKEYLKTLIPKIRKFLKEELGLTLHPKKIYLQPCNKGVSFLNAYVASHKSGISKRIRKNFIKKIHNIMDNYDNMSIKEKQKSETIINSYLGLAKRYNTYNFRKDILSGWLDNNLNDIENYNYDKIRIYTNDDALDNTE